MFGNRKKFFPSGDLVGGAGWRTHASVLRARRTIREPLSLHETIRRASFYGIGISALWGVAYVFFLLSGYHWP